MQIHEITNTKLDEGVGSFLGKAAGGLSNFANKVVGAVSPVGPAKAAYAGAIRPQQTDMLGKKVAQIWANYTQQLKAATPDPARYTTMYQQALTAFVQKNLLSGQSINSAMNKQEINQLITQITAAKDNPQQVTALIGKLVQQAAVSQQDVEKQHQAQIINRDPAIIKVDGRTYGLNDKGQWADIKTNREPEQSVKAYLDQLAGIN